MDSSSKDSPDEEVIEVLLETADLRRERDELRAEVERLRTALMEIIQGDDEFSTVSRIAREALESRTPRRSSDPATSDRRESNR